MENGKMHVGRRANVTTRAFRTWGRNGMTAPRLQPACTEADRRTDGRFGPADEHSDFYGQCLCSHLMRDRPRAISLLFFFLAIFFWPESAGSADISAHLTH